jgi:hypothetical protein
MIKLIERTDIKLETPADCYKALLDGFTLKFHDEFGSFVKLVDGNQVSDISPNLYTFNTPSAYKVYEEKELEWHDELPTEKGELPVVLCWVGSVPGFRKDYIQGIYAKSYNENGEIIFESFATNWGYAIPVTKEEFENMNGNYLK